MYRSPRPAPRREDHGRSSRATMSNVRRNGPVMPRGVPSVSTGRDHSRGPGIMEVISKSPFRRSPVTVTHLPVTRCRVCRRTVV
jgi:hypothetical protein